MNKKWFFLLAVMVSAALLAAPAHPNFTGKWKLNMEKSKLQVPNIEGGTITIDHQDPVFRFSRVFVINGAEDRLDFEMKSDGNEVVKTEGQMKVTSKLYWDGDTLAFVTRLLRPDGREAINAVVYRLEDEGKIFIAAESFRGPVLTYDNVWVLDRIE